MVWDSRHHLCAVHVVNNMQCVVFNILLQCMLCWCYIFFEHIVLGSCTASCGTSSIFMSQMAISFSNAIRADVSFGVFFINAKASCFSFFLSCFKQCVLGLFGLLGLNAVIILPLYCNAIIAWRCLSFLVSQALTTMLAKNKTKRGGGVGGRGWWWYSFCAWMYWVPLWWFVKSTLSFPTPFSFVYCYVINQRGRWLWLSVCVWGGGGNVTECIVCVPAHDPLTYSFLSSFLFFDWAGIFMAPII